MVDGWFSQLILLASGRDVTLSLETDETLHRLAVTVISHKHLL